MRRKNVTKSVTIRGEKRSEIQPILDVYEKYRMKHDEYVWGEITNEMWQAIKTVAKGLTHRA